VVERDRHVEQRDALRHRELELIDVERRQIQSASRGRSGLGMGAPASSAVSLTMPRSTISASGKTGTSVLTGWP
jgi:hypothetical protein